MTPDEIRRVRAGIRRHHPGPQCGRVSELIAARYGLWTVIGERARRSHVWVLTPDGRYLDATADQFDGDIELVEPTDPRYHPWLLEAPHRPWHDPIVLVGAHPWCGGLCLASPS